MQQKLVVSERGIQKKHEIQVDMESPEKLKVQFYEQFLLKKQNMNENLSQNKSMFSAKPYFLECKEALEKTVIVNEILPPSESIIHKPQYPGILPPQNIFSTYSRRFPYDQPMRATTSHQELRKKILQQGDLKSIYDMFSPPQSSNKKFRVNSLFNIPPIKNESASKFIPNEPVQEEQKEIKAILKSMENNQNNAKNQMLSSSQFYIKQDAMTKVDKNSSQQYNLQQSTEQQINVNQSNLKSNNNNLQLKNDIRLQSQDTQSKQNKLEELAKESQKNKPSLLNQIGNVTPQSKQANQQQLPINNNSNLNKQSEFFDNPLEKASSEPKSEPKKFILNNFSPIKGGMSKFMSVPNISQQKASNIFNESVLKNKIHKWQLIKQNYQQKDKKLHSQILEKVSIILEEKGNKPVHVATSFINDLKNADAEIDELYDGTTKQKKRYQERLKLFHIKKYKNFMSDVKMHTAQLTDKHHQIAHLGQKLLESSKNEHV
ncbi:hypothetical protein ABPG72_020297 [Tetrahymena utriculariae]